MKHNSSNRRSRNRNNNGGARKNNKTQVFDSNGPDVRIRGTAYQVCEKYLTLAKDAAAIGDTIVAENFLQHAEHYQRIINEWGVDNNRTVSSDKPAENDVKQAKSTQKDEDLGLPGSILGPEVKVSEKTDSKEAVALEDA